MLLHFPALLQHVTTTGAGRHTALRVAQSATLALLMLILMQELLEMLPLEAG